MESRSVDNRLSVLQRVNLMPGGCVLRPPTPASTAQYGVSGAVRANYGLNATQVTSASTKGGAIFATIQKALGGIGNIVSGAYDLIKEWGTRNPINGAVAGATIGAGVVGLGSALGAGALAGSWAGPIGMLVGAAVGGLLGFIKTGKHQDQVQRDQVRQAFQEHGILDKNWTVGLADGTRYDIGIDGGPKAEFGNLRPYELDFNQELVGQVVGLVNPFMAVIAGGNQKIQSDFTGYFVRAAMSNADGNFEKMKDNVLAIFQQFQMSPEELINGLVRLVEENRVGVDDFQAYLGGIRELFT